MPQHPGIQPAGFYPAPPPRSRPRGSRLTEAQWRKANSNWSATWSHAHGVAEPYPWGSVMWGVHGLNPYGMVVAEPEESVAAAHRAAAELSSGQLSTLGPRLPVSKRALLGAILAVILVATILSALAVGDGAVGGGVLLAAVAGGAVAGFPRRISPSRRTWRHLTDPVGISALMPHLLWITDLTEEAPEHAEVVWPGVRQILWESPTPHDAVAPVERISQALATAVAARRRRDSAVDGGLPEPLTDRLDSVAAGVVGALGFEEDVYLQVAEDYETEAGDDREDDQWPA